MDELVSQSRVNIRTVNGGVASGGPTSAKLQIGRMVALADENLAWGNALALGVAAEAQIIVSLRQQHAVDRTVRVVAGGAAFA